ncbi:MAG: cyclic nucleotide-binding domain-containing protein [Desulfobacteraceae bacterium]|nr:MAG: cyclic nucleotide-binding domain-containing protein [Desulfobacteraceae bacterium]
MDELIKFLGLSELFKDIHPKDLEAIASIIDREDFGVNDDVFGEDDLGDNLHILYSGRIQIIMKAVWRKKKEEMIQIIQPGEIFGEFSFIDGCRRSASAVSIEKSRVLILSKAKFDKFSIDKPTVALTIMQNFAWILTQKIRNTTMLWRNDKMKIEKLGRMKKKSRHDAD